MPIYASTEEIFEDDDELRYHRARKITVYSEPVTPEFVAEFLNRRESENNKTEAAARLIFRKLVDAWLESGKRKGVDRPWDRRPDDLDLRNYLEKNPPITVVSRGDIYVSFQNFGGLHSTKPPKRWAYYTFLNFLAGPREKLSRCDSCSAYFSHRHLPVEGVVIKGGSFCSECKHKANVVTALESRRRQRERLIESAAGFWRQYGEKKRRCTQAEWVTQQMRQKYGNLSFSGAPTWKNTRWVTRYRADIEAAAVNKRGRLYSR
jgi:hypothetical protein